MPDSSHSNPAGPDTHFISCDWGTTSLRLRLVEAHTLRVLAEVKDDQGIAVTFQSWKNSGKAEAERISFYRTLLETRVQQLQASSFPGIPLIISGMASSSIGMKELPYKELPFRTDGKDLRMEILEATTAFPRRTLLLSGVRSPTDVMRGEETQLVGCFPSLSQQIISGERIFIFPGTHSKHIRVRDGKAIDFKTFMTGEFFHLLTRHSILAGSVAETTASAEAAFQQGVLASIGANLLHQSFRVRTHQLFGTLSKEDNYHYLSGLLIGSECRDLTGTGLPLTLVGSGPLRDLYTAAISTLGIPDVEIQELDPAVIKAHARLSKSFLGK